MDQLKVLIIDDDRERREKISRILPDYMEAVMCGSGDGAINCLKPDKEGRLFDLVILYGDDRKSFGLYIFDWMINKASDPRTAQIPVIVLTEDEFSDRSMEFLEIGDAFFYEGQIDEGRLFSVINDALERAEFLPEPEETVYEETKSPDRLMGQSVKAPGAIGQMRSIVLDMETRLQNLEAAIARGQKRVSDIRMLLDAAQKAKEDDDEFIPARHRGHSAARNDADTGKMPAFLDKARENVRQKEDERKRANERAAAAGGRVNDRPENAQGPFTIPAYDPVSSLKQKAMSNPFGAMNAQGTVRVEERPKERPQVRPDDKRTIVIADDDVKTRKLCSLFLTQKYHVVAYDSGMRTVDHFIKSSADLLLINPMMKGMSGLTTVSSVRRQPGCANIPVMYIVGEEFTGDRTTLIGNGVVGILNKPVKREVLAQAVDGFFRSTMNMF